MSGRLSRRALLGGAAAAPLLPRHPDPESSSGVSGSRSPPHGQVPGWTLKQVQGDGGADGEVWRGAIAAFRAAEGEVRAVERATAGSSAEAEERWLPVYEARLDALGAAVRAVLLAAAPDFAAFAAKLALFFEHEREPTRWTRLCWRRSGRMRGG